MAGSRRRGIVLTLAALALTAGPLAPASAPAATARDPCAFADRLLAAGLLRDAALRFHAVAKAAKRSQRPLRCAVDGLSAIQGARQARADEILSQATDGKPPDLPSRTATRLANAAATGQFREVPHVVAREIADGDGRVGFKIALVLAGAHYPQVAASVAEATLAAHPSAAPSDRLRDLLLAARARTAHQHLAAATGLSHAGLDAQARSELEAAIKADPSIEVPDELASPTRRQPWWNEALGTWGPRIVTAAEIVAVVLAVIVGVLLLILIILRGLRRFRARVRIKPFTGGPDDSCRAATAAAVRENFGRLNDEGGGRRAKFVSSSGESFTAIPAKVAEAFPQAGWIADLIVMLGALIPTRARRVTAELRPRDPERGAGLTITFGRLHGKIFDEETLWEADYGPPPKPTTKDQVAYDSVALAAAAWLTFISARHTLGRSLTRGWLPSVRSELPDWVPFPRERVDPFKVLGTKDWRSYALFAAGADREQRYALFATGDDRERERQRGIAQQCYREALARDPSNHGALFNLVGLDLQETPLDALDRKRALKRLKQVRRQTNRQESLWYRVRYTEAVAHLREPDPDPEHALKAAVDLCASLLDDLHRLDHRFSTGSIFRTAYRGRRRDIRRRFLCEQRPAALILLACMLKAAGGSDAAVGVLSADRLLRELDAARALRADAIVAKLQQAPAVVTHHDLVAYAQTFKPFMPNALYVLACYRSRMAAASADAELWEKAEHLLHTAVKRDPPLGRAALVDESFAGYRADPERRRKLELLVRRLARV